MRPGQRRLGEKQAMQSSATAPHIRLSGPIKSSIIVAVLGAVGLVAIIQWTAFAVRKHVGIASLSIFPAALSSQRAGTAFERMNREYSNAVITQDVRSLANADREAATVVSSLDSAGSSMGFNPGRQQQIVSLMHRVAGLQARSRTLYTAATESNATLPAQNELADLAHENKAVESALETLQSDLASDFKGQLALIDELLSLLGILEAVVLIGVIIALFFSVRTLLKTTVRRREDEIMHQVHVVQEDERRMLRALIDNVPDFMYVKDKQSRFLVANSHLARVVGAETPEAVLGKTDFDFFPPEMASVFRADELSVIASGKPLYNHEEKAIDCAGNEAYILSTKVPLRDSQGEVIGIAGVGRDISDRKSMEKALREAEQRYRGIFDKAIVGIFQSTPDGRFLSVNSAMTFIFGYDSPEEMIAAITDITGQLFVNPKRGVEFGLIMDRVGGVRNFECEVFRKNGEKAWIAMNIRAIRENGAVVRYEGMIDDITERILLREQLFQAQKLESVGQLAAGIAHEINTPTQYIGDNVRFLQDAFQDMQKLLGNYDKLLRAAKDHAVSCETVNEISAAVEQVDAAYLVEEIPKAIDQTLEGVSRVAALVNAMKEFSHPGAKDKVSLDLNHAIQSTITVSRNEWKYIAEMETDYDSTLPTIPCLPGEFNQVILNLIVNAAHAIAAAAGAESPKKGKIKVQTRRCQKWAEIRIQDNGTGIPEKIRTRIFDPFFTTKEIGKGTGQGLAIARSVVVDKHGGTIHCETEEGKGTTFIIRLPYNGKALSAKEAA
jgi:PAS domain S-box-containing protein